MNGVGQKDKNEKEIGVGSKDKNEKEIGWVRSAKQRRKRRRVGQ